ncbi:MAG: hypothetical protein HKN08_03495 [Gammaproteobacteria bacterium]|nr:hypothetical protein [Gammaproteobacteria bacterium]
MKNNNKKFLLMLFTLSSVFLLSGCATTAQEEPPAGVLQGVFTAEQAQSGRSTFNNVCRTCHIPRDFRTIFKQSDDTEALLNDYFDLISTTMPQDSPGSLSTENYLNVMSYLLSLNGFPSEDEGN